MKFLVVVAALVLLVWLLVGRSGRAAKPPAPRRSAPVPPAEGMLACAHCGVHVPRSEAVLDEGVAYCSEAHRRSGPRVPGARP
jgi:uncharacterized protein